MKWWNKNRVQCTELHDESNGISIENIGGVFVVIMFGVALGLVGEDDCQNVLFPTGLKTAKRRLKMWQNCCVKRRLRIWQNCDSLCVMGSHEGTYFYVRRKKKKRPGPSRGTRKDLTSDIIDFLIDCVVNRFFNGSIDISVLLASTRGVK